MKEKIVCVEWLDACFNQGYYDKKEPENFEQVKVRSVGHLVKNTGKEVILSIDRFYCNHGKMSDDRHISTIPKKMIEKIVYLGEK